MILNGGPFLIVHGDEQLARDIATKLAEAKDWSALDAEPGWNDIAFDPLVLRLMAEYPGKIGLPVIDEDEMENIVPYGPEDGEATNVLR